MSKPTRYNLTMRIIHWVMAVIIIGLIASGFYMVDLPRDHPDKWTLYGLHKSFGVTVLCLVIIRMIVRFISKIPPLLTDFPPWTVTLAKAVHLLLYIGMIAIPISGYVMSDAGGHGVKWFGVVMPDLFTTDKELSGIAHTLHGIMPYILLGIIVLHMAGALKDRRVLKRMIR